LIPVRHHFRRNTRAYVATICLSAIFLAAGCKKKSVEAAAAPDTNPAEIKLTPDVSFQLKIGEPPRRDVASKVEVAARIDTDASQLARVGSPVAGRITRLLALEGQHVKRGSALATLHSTDLSDTQFSFIKAYSQEKLAEQATDRAEQLVKADVIGRAELERRRAELLQASAEVAAFGTQLRGLGMSEAALGELKKNRQLNADYPVLSSISGTILERKVTLGQIVQPAELAFLVADLSTVWVLADVPEEHAAHLYKGMQVKVHIPALPNEVIQGQLAYVSPIVDPATRTVQVRMDLHNPQGLYKPAMLAAMTFVDASEPKITVPATAVVREDNKDHVFVQLEPNRFILREVTLGAEDADDRVLESGVKPGEKIVLDGAFHLNNQRKQNAIRGGK